MTTYRIDAVGLIGVFTGSEMALVDSAQSFEVDLNVKNINPQAELSLLITESKSRLGDYIGRKYDFSITRLGIVDTLIKDWDSNNSEEIFCNCIEEFDYNEDY